MNRIRQLRDANNIKQATLAEAICVSRAALSGYETGKYQADIDTYKKIADFFSVDLDYLLCADTKKEPATIADDGLSDLDRELISMLCQLSPEDVRRVKDFAAGLKAARE